MNQMESRFPRGMALALAATFLLVLVLPAGSSAVPASSATLGVTGQSVPMTEADLASAVGGKAPYCDKALISCYDGCSRWGGFGSGILVAACDVGCGIQYTQCGS